MNLRSAWVTCLVLILGCSPGNDDGGGGGGGGGNGGGNNNPPGNNPAPLMVVTTVPDDGDLDIDVGVNVIITFNQNIAAASVNANTITFTSNLGPVDGAFTVQGAAVTFNPTNDLPFASPIVGTVTTDVMSTTGAQLAQNYPFAFGTAGATQVIADGDGLEQPCVAVSAGGLVMTMWVQNDAGTYRLFAREWEALTGWAMTTEFAVTGDPIQNLKLHCTENNEAVAAWAEVPNMDVGGSSIFTARFTAGSGWDDIETLSTDASYGQVNFVMHREGWGGISYRTYPTFVLRYLDPNGTWGAEEAMSGPWSTLSAGANGELYTLTYMYNPAVGIGPVGASRYVPGTGWSYEVLGGNGYVSVMGTTGTPSGGMAYSSYVGDTAVSRFDGMQWTDFTTIDGPPGITQFAEATAAPTGEAYLTWVVQDNLGARALMGAYMDANGTWTDIEVLDPGAEWPLMPQAACTDAGEGWVVFSQTDGVAYSIWLARYVPGTGWAMTAQIDEDDFYSTEPRVAAQGPGGCAVWLRTNASTQLMARLLN